MPAIHLNHLHFRYSLAVDVIVDADAHIGPGWTGVVGANGSGKTTLLALVAGQLAPSRGRVLIDPADAVVVSCPQTVDGLSTDIERFAASLDGHDIAMRGRLDLDPADLTRWPTLSPGERKRWQIGAALSRRPDVLLLDEPTNHLDGAGRDLLIGELDRFRGVGLVVSHDRSLLEGLTNRTLRLDHGRVTLWNGAYEAAKAAWTAEEAEQAAERERLKEEARRAQRFLVEQRRINEQKRAAFRRKNNTSSFKDIDARSAARQAKHREGEKAAGKLLSTAAKRAERARERLAAVEVRGEVGRDLFIDFAPSPKRILTTHTGPLYAGGHLVAEHVAITVERSDRIWLRGPNGIGKTTLLRSLVANAGIAAERMLVLPQELTPEMVAESMGSVRSLGRGQRGRVLAVVAALGVDPDVLLASNSPSPGEARKVAMALGLGRQAWMVLLDEPTNHLDLPSVERLEAALASYPGAVVVATHDDAFAEAIDLRPFDLGD